MLSHSHPVGIDGARVIAAAQHWLLAQPRQALLSPSPSPSRQGSGSGSSSRAAAEVEAAAAAGRMLAYLEGGGRVGGGFTGPATRDMAAKLRLLRQLADAGQLHVGEIASWQAFFSSTSAASAAGGAGARTGAPAAVGSGASWAALTGAVAALTYHGYATAGNEAAAVALAVFASCWGRPRQALALAAALGGSSPAVGQLVRLWHAGQFESGRL
jgi:hypothetical protein